MPKVPEGMAQRPVIMSQEMTDWYRELAFRTRTSQQEHFRRALGDYRDKIERDANGKPHEVDRGLALVRKFADGDGVPTSASGDYESVGRSAAIGRYVRLGARAASHE
jgi:hypothetical protein